MVQQERAVAQGHTINQQQGLGHREIQRAALAPGKIGCDFLNHHQRLGGQIGPGDRRGQAGIDTRAGALIGGGFGV